MARSPGKSRTSVKNTTSDAFLCPQLPRGPCPEPGLARSFLTAFSYARRVVTSINEQPVVPGEPVRLPPLPKYNQTMEVGSKYSTVAAKVSARRDGKFKFLETSFLTLWPLCLLYVLILACSVGLSLIQPQLTGWLMRCLQNPGQSGAVYAAAASVPAAASLVVLIEQLQKLVQRAIVTRTRMGVSGMVYRGALGGGLDDDVAAAAAAAKFALPGTEVLPTVQSLVVNTTLSAANGLINILSIWAPFVQLSIGLFIIVTKLGRTLVQLAILVLAVFYSLQFAIDLAHRRAARHSYAVRERRIRLINGTFKTISYVKATGQEPETANVLSNALAAQQAAKIKTERLARAGALVGHLGPPVLQCVCVIYGTIHGTDPSDMFVSLSLISSLARVIQRLPTSVITTMNARVPVSKIEAAVDYAKEHAAPGLRRNEKGGVELNLLKADGTNTMMHIEAGTSCAICGPVGSGKTSLLRAILAEQNYSRHSAQADATTAGYAPQEPTYYAGSIENNVALCDTKSHAYDHARFSAAISAAQLTHDIQRVLDPKVERPAGGENLSGGQRARVNLARALYCHSHLLVLDSAFAQLDANVMAAAVRAVLGRKASIAKDRTIVLATHAPRRAATCDQIVLLDADGYCAYAGPRSGAADQMRRVMGQEFTNDYTHVDEVNVTEELHEHEQEQEDAEALLDGVRTPSNPLKLPQEASEVSVAAAQLLTEAETVTELVCKGRWQCLVARVAADPVVFVLQETFKVSSGTFMMLIVLSVLYQIARYKFDSILTSFHSLQTQSIKVPIYAQTMIFVIALIEEFDHIGRCRAARLLNKHSHQHTLTHIMHAPLSYLTGNGRAFTKLALTSEFETMSDAMKSIRSAFTQICRATSVCIIVFAASSRGCGLVVLLTVGAATVAAVACRRVISGASTRIAAASPPARAALSQCVAQICGTGGVVVRAAGASDVFYGAFTSCLDVTLSVNYWRQVLGQWLTLRSEAASALAAIMVSMSTALAATTGTATSVHTLALTRVIRLGRMLSSLADDLSRAHSDSITAHSAWMAADNLEDEGDWRRGALDTKEAELIAVEARCGPESVQAAAELDAAAAFRATETLMRVAAAADTAADTALPPSRERGLAVSDFTVKYRPDLPPAVDNVSFTVAPGEHVALMGRTGAGKTSMVSGLLRLVPPAPGSRAYLGGESVTDIGLHDLRRTVVLVPQGAELPPFAVRDLFGSTRDEAIWAAFDSVGVTQALKAKNGLETPTSELSAGQRQLVCVARALSAAPRLLLLDEISANLDATSEQAVLDTVHSITEHGDVPVLNVCHSIACSVAADTVGVMDGGRIVEWGRHEELSESGPYARLVHAAKAKIV